MINIIYIYLIMILKSIDQNINIIRIHIYIVNKFNSF